jgi:hypothetical protein
VGKFQGPCYFYSDSCRFVREPNDVLAYRLPGRKVTYTLFHGPSIPTKAALAQQVSRAAGSPSANACSSIRAFGVPMRSNASTARMARQSAWSGRAPWAAFPFGCGPLPNWWRRPPRAVRLPPLPPGPLAMIVTALEVPSSISRRL